MSRQFTGNGYVEYNIISVEKHKAIYSDEDELKLTFRTVQPSGLLFQSTSSGGDWADYITLELVGGRLRCVYMYFITHCSLLARRFRLNGPPGLVHGKISHACLKAAVSRNSAKLGNYKMPFKLRKT